MLFLAAVVASALLYAAWVSWVPLLPSNLYIPLLDLGKITGYRGSSAILFVAIVLGLYASYALGYRALANGRSRIGLVPVFAAGAVFCAELLWAYPATAADVFGYIAHGRLLALHGANPFIVAPSAFAGDPIVPFLAFADEPTQYGPAWVLLGDAFANLARGNLLVEVLLYKMTAATAHLVGAALVFQIAARLADARAARLSAYIYLWNPLLLWEMVGNAHNDGLMMLLALVGVRLFIAGYDLVVLMAVSAGALVKVPIAVIGPTLLVGLWRRSWARAVEGVLLAFALAVAVYRPFWEGLDTLTALHRSDLFTASFGSVLRLALTPTLGEANATVVARTVSLSAFAVVAVLAVLFAIRARSNAELFTAAYATLLGALLLATTWFQAWYIVWPLALGAALATPSRHLEVALLSLGGLLQYVVFIYLWVIGVLPIGDNLGVQAAAYLAIIGPLLVSLLLRTTPPSWARLTSPSRATSGLIER